MAYVVPHSLVKRRSARSVLNPPLLIHPILAYTTEYTDPVSPYSAVGHEFQNCDREIPDCPSSSCPSLLDVARLV